MGFIASFIAIVLIVIISPILLLLSVIIFVWDGFPILFRQERVGLHHQLFTLYKFRTMKPTKSQDRIADYQDIRITQLGTILRKTKLDELPQLFNIAVGNMRFVGPRPEISKYITEGNATFLNIVKPGITDYSSILFRNESQVLSRTGGSSQYGELLKLKLKLCQIYSEDKNFVLDAKLVLITIISLIFPQLAESLVLRLLNVGNNPGLAREINFWLKA